MRITIHPTDASIGAVMRGVDLATVPDKRTLESIEEALEEYGVLIFKGQSHITPEQQIAFSRALGPLDIRESTAGLLPSIRTVCRRQYRGRARHVFPLDETGNWNGIPITCICRCRPVPLYYWQGRCRRKAATRCLPA